MKSNAFNQHYLPRMGNESALAILDSEKSNCIKLALLKKEMH